MESATTPTFRRGGASYGGTELPAHQPLPQFLMLGDSLTQGAYSQKNGFALGAELQDAFIRRFDVVNRGFSGYNTDHILLILQDIIPTPQQASIKFITIWFGANDANPLSSHPSQHVPLPRFRFNLNDILSNRALTAHSPNLILITPPPVEESMLAEYFGGARVEGRTAGGTRAYAEAVREIGVITGVPVVDVWSRFMSIAGWKEGMEVSGRKEEGGNEGLKGLLSDGLHLTPAGYRVVFDELLKVMKEKWPEYPPYRMPYSVKVPWETTRGEEHWDVTG